MKTAYCSSKDRAKEGFERPTGRGKSLLLIGPGAHFGAQILEKFSSEGYALGVISQSVESALALKTYLSQAGRSLEFETANILDTTRFGAAVESLSQKLGGVTCLIYNPKVSIKKNGLATTPEELARSIAINVTGALAAIQHALPYFVRSEDASVIVTGGGFKDVPDVQRFALSVGKSGLHGLARAMVGPLQRRGVKLKTIVIDGVVRENGPIDPNELANFFFHVAKSPRTTVFKYSARESERDRRHQPSLFDWAPAKFY